MSAGDTAKTVAAGVGAGAVRGAGNGAKYSLIGSAVAGGFTALAVGGVAALFAPFGAVMAVASLAFVVAGGATAIGVFVPGTILGSAIGAVTRPFTEFKKQREAKAHGVEQARMTMQDELKLETQKNLAMKKAMAKDYQVENHLANDDPNHHRDKLAKPGASKQRTQPAPAGVGQRM